jgi:hypothetical protein
LKFGIDEPAAGSAALPAVCFQGWCFDEEGRPIHAIRARMNGRAVAGYYGRHRPDVREALNGPPASEWSGFSLALRLSPGVNRIGLEAKVGDAGWTEFHQVALPASLSAVAGHAWRMMRFWPRAVLGRPTALGVLARWEQDFIFARFAQSGRYSLSTSPQHPPREVKMEQFPPPRLAPKRLPKITVVTPSFQQGGFIESTLQSVLRQQGVLIDLMVQDGGSTDGTTDILRRYAPRLKHWASGPDGGLGDAIRRGFASAECGPDDVMAYLNSDDLLMPGAARFVAEYFASHPAVDVVYGHRVLIDEIGLEVGRWFTPRSSSFDPRLHDLVPQETLFWRKRVWDRVGGVNPTLQYCVDWDLLLRFAESGATFRRLPWFLGLFRLHPQQKTVTQVREVGIPEMDRLRDRSLSRKATWAELDADMRQARLDSAVLAALWQRGWRL